MTGAADRWANAGEYERFMGRWSRLVAREFLGWISVPWRQRWLDVGCGTGALSEIILSRCQPLEVVGVDRSLAYATAARHARREPFAQFLAADATQLPLRATHFDAAVSGLVINFIPEPARA
ncbi:MAG: class I SAM-dependent methyltransferase, partial [Candidatus Eiseniibacteriota bacterium]